MKLLNQDTIILFILALLLMITGFILGRKKPQEEIPQAEATDPSKDLVSVMVSNKKVNVEVIKRNPKTLLVRLPDGHIIKRHRKKHMEGDEK